MTGTFGRRAEPTSPAIRRAAVKPEGLDNPWPGDQPARFSGFRGLRTSTFRTAALDPRLHRGFRESRLTIRPRLAAAAWSASRPGQNHKAAGYPAGLTALDEPVTSRSDRLLRGAMRSRCLSRGYLPGHHPGAARFHSAAHPASVVSSDRGVGVQLGWPVCGGCVIRSWGSQERICSSRRCSSWWGSSLRTCCIRACSRA
jgi:hypothetical protein